MQLDFPSMRRRRRVSVQFVPQVALGALLVFSEGALAQTGDTVATRECKQAAATIAGERLELNAAIRIRECRLEVGEVVPALWLHPPSDLTGLRSLFLASTGPFDRRILAAATRAAGDLSIPANVRAGAVLVMTRYITNGIGVTMVREPAEGLEWWPYPSWEHDGTDDLPKEFSQRAPDIIAGIERVEKSDPSREVRLTSSIMLEWIRSAPRR
jgi:hypothetical protein